MAKKAKRRSPAPKRKPAKSTAKKRARRPAPPPSPRQATLDDNNHLDNGGH